VAPAHSKPDHRTEFGPWVGVTIALSP
jgi:hypothetical protein